MYYFCKDRKRVELLPPADNDHDLTMWMSPVGEYDVSIPCVVYSIFYVILDQTFLARTTCNILTNIIMFFSVCFMVIGECRQPTALSCFLMWCDVKRRASSSRCWSFCLGWFVGEILWGTVKFKGPYRRDNFHMFEYHWGRLFVYCWLSWN